MPLPPRDLRCLTGPFKNPYDYIAAEKEFFKYLKNVCNVKPNEAILDVGCGCGQAAAPLTKYLNKQGSYEGFDIINTLTEWCEKNISAKYPNFKFKFADIFNGQYNSNGRIKASQYKFPYKNNSFDFIFLKSVFTHMTPEDMENYFSEISRTLKKNGRCFISYFLLNNKSLEAINKGASALNFKYIFGNYRSISEVVRENAICYNEDYIFDLYKKNNLAIKKPIYYGAWKGLAEKNMLGYQDMILAEKK